MKERGARRGKNSGQGVHVCLRLLVGQRCPETRDHDSSGTRHLHCNVLEGAAALTPLQRSLERVMNSAEKPYWAADSSVSSVLRRSPVFRISKLFLRIGTQC